MGIDKWAMKRKEDINLIHKIVQAHKDGIEIESLTAMMTFNYGMGKKRCMEYIHDLIALGFIRRHGSTFFAQEPEKVIESG